MLSNFSYYAKLLYDQAIQNNTLVQCIDARVRYFVDINANVNWIKNNNNSKSQLTDDDARRK